MQRISYINSSQYYVLNYLPQRITYNALENFYFFKTFFKIITFTKMILTTFVENNDKSIRKHEYR